MMTPVEWIMLAGVIASVLGSVGGTIWQNKKNEQLNRQNNDLQQQLAGQANQWNIEQWQRENLYNDPSNQVARLAGAGINPALVYGSGGIMNEAAASPQATMANTRAATVQNPMSNLDPLTFANLEKTKAETQAIKDANSRENEKQPITLESLNKVVEQFEAQNNNLIELLNGIKSDNRKKAVEAYIAEETKDAAIDEIRSSAKLTHNEASYYVLSLMSEIGLRESQEELNRASTALTDEQRSAVKSYVDFAREYLKLAKEEQDWAREQFNAEKPWLNKNAQNQAAIMYRNAHIREKEDELLHKYGDVQTSMELLRVLIGSGHDVVDSYVEMNPRGRRYKRTINRGGQKTVVVQQ